MAASSLTAELARRITTHDENYFKKGAYVFILRGPKATKTGPLLFSGTAQFPLIINPDDFKYRLPFAAEITGLQEGGVVAEENGIVIAEITMSGTTGFKLRAALNDISAGRGDGEFTGILDPGLPSGIFAGGSAGLSGHMHFWRLANRCFDGYSALKKNAATAHQTSMEFHSLKDDLHLRVIPREFELTRSASRERVTYRYNIRLAVIGAATETDIVLLSPDTEIQDGRKNPIPAIRSALQSASAAISDLTAWVDELRRTITSAAQIIDDATAIVRAGTDFIRGIKRFIDIPRQFINATSRLVDSAATLTAESGTLGLDAEQSWLELSDSFDKMVVAARDHFLEPYDEKARRYQRSIDGYREGQDEDKDIAVTQLAQTAASGQGRLTQAQVYGAVRPGDQTRGRADPTSRSRVAPGKYRGFTEIVIGQGDTVQSISARHLGNPNDWPDIVIVNQLRPPYITNGAQIPGTKQPGDRMLIPIKQAGKTPNTLTTGDPSVGASQIDDLLGVDFERIRIGKNSFGWEIDPASGGTDVRKVRGIANLGQGLEGRLRTIQGENILYPNFGIPRLIGGRNDGADVVNAKYNARQQVLADLRVESVGTLQFVQDKDSLSIEMEVRPVGFTNARTIARTIT